MQTSPETTAPNVDPGTELSKLQSEHNELETRLAQLDGHIYLTPDEQVERKTIQKMKLRLKDRIHTLGAKA